MSATGFVSHKRCATCGNVKEAVEFNKSSSQPDGLSRTCRACDRAWREARKAASKVGVDPATGTDQTIVAQRVASDFIQPKETLATWAAVQMIAADGDLAPNLLFKGPSGCGKTESARDLARRAGLAFYKIDCSSIVDPESWFGTREIVDGDKGPITVYKPSLFVRAAQEPCVMLLDEANRAPDSIRNILISFLDGSRSVTNPVNGETIIRHPACFVIMTANVGLAFTGTYAMDPAFLTRSLTSNFDYLDEPTETALLISRTGVAGETAALFVRFAQETRNKARHDEDFTPISTRELLHASQLAAKGLDEGIAVRQAIINAASDEGGGDSARAKLDYIWRGIRPAQVTLDNATKDE